jgi:hypothetical protein
MSGFIKWNSSEADPANAKASPGAQHMFEGSEAVKLRLATGTSLPLFLPHMLLTKIRTDHTLYFSFISISAPG